MSSSSKERVPIISHISSLESGITIRGSRKKAKPSTEGRTMNRVTPPPFFNLGDSPPEDDVFFAPTAAQPKNATAGAGEFRIPAPPPPPPPGLVTFFISCVAFSSTDAVSRKSK